MSVTPFADQERELLIELAYLFAHRADREREISTRLSEGLGAAERAHGASVEAARRAHELGMGAAVQEHTRSRAEAEVQAGAKLESATRRMRADLGAFQERTQAYSRAITARQEETEWLAEALVESGNARIGPAFEAVRTTITERCAEFDEVERRAQAALARSRLAPLPAATGAPAQAEPRPEQARETLREVQASAEALAVTDARLHRIVEPALLSASSILIVVLLSAMIGAAGATWSEWSDLVRVAPRGGTGAGIGAGAALIVMLAARAIVRRRVPRAGAAVSEALARARGAAAYALRTAEVVRDTKLADLASLTEKEWAGSRATVAALNAEVERRTGTAEPELRARHEKRLGRLRADHERAVFDIDRRLAERRGALDAELAAAVRAADDTLAPVKRSLEEADRADRAELEGTWSTRLAGALQTAGALAAEAERVSPPWGAPVWERVPPAAEAPAGVRFGSLRVDLGALPGGLSSDPRLAVPGSRTRELPLMIDLMGKGSVLIHSSPDRRGAALAVLNNIVLRLLTGLPPGKARFTFVDAVGLGQSFAGLMHITDYEETIVGERIWTDPRHIEQRLTDLSEHMETVIQKYLRNEYETIQAYNAEAGEVAEPYRFLVIADFPSALSDNAARRLTSIATSGARCGVFTLIMTTQSPPPAAAAARGAPLAGAVPWAELERHSTVLNLIATGARWAREPFAPWPVELEQPPDEATTTRMLHAVGEHLKDSTRVRVPFALVEPPDGALWTADAASDIHLPLGRAGAKKLQHLSLGRGTAQHALIAGRTGSGKSTLLHVIVTTAAMWYSPDQVELYLVDFKKGVEFKTYATHRLAHARVVAVESEREFGVSVLRRLDAELTRRGTLFREAGVQDLPAFRRVQARRSDPRPLARVLLVVDEFQEFFVEDDRLAQDASLLLDRLVRQGRAFGVHVILGSQTLGGAYSLARATLGQMAVRVALQCSETDSYLILSEDNPGARLLSRPGEAIYNDTSGTVEGNSPFQIAWLPDDARDADLRRIAERVGASGRVPPPPIVFEGHVPADLGANRPLADLLSGRGERPAAPTLWLGEPLAIKDPTGITLRAQSAANVFIAGNQEETAVAMVAGAVIGFGAWLGFPGTAPQSAGLGRLDGGGETAPPGSAGSHPAVIVLDATPADLPHGAVLARALRALGPEARLAGPRDARDALSGICAEIDRRDAAAGADHRPILLVIHGLQRFRDLRKADEFSFTDDADRSRSAAPLLMKALRSGPSVGVHTLVWCDTATNADRMLERSALREFNARVLMQMSANDSTQLIESPAGASLGLNRALLYSDDTGVVEKFRPYATPGGPWTGGSLARHTEQDDPSTPAVQH